MSESPFMTDGPAFERRVFERGDGDLDRDAELDQEELDDEDALEDDEDALEDDEDALEDDEDALEDDEDALEDDEDALEDDEDALEDDEDDLESEELDDDEDGELAGNPGHEVAGTAPHRSSSPQERGALDAFNRAEGGAARAVLEHIARSIVDEPDSVVVEVSPARSGIKLSLHVAPGDMGRIIGRRGRVAQALRTVVRAAAASEGGDAVVDIVD